MKLEQASLQQRENLRRSLHRATLAKAATTSRGTVTVTRRDRDRHHLLCALCVLTPIGQNTGQEEIKADLRRSRERRGAVVRAQVHVGIAERPACSGQAQEAEGAKRPSVRLDSHSACHVSLRLAARFLSC